LEIETTRDFKRPRAAVLSKFRDPERLESVMSGMSIKAERRALPPSAAWDCSIVWRNELRRFAATLVETAPDETMVLGFTSDLADSSINMDFYDLPDGGCRVIAKGTVTAHTIMAKLALQSMRLLSGKAEQRISKLIHNIGRP